MQAGTQFLNANAAAAQGKGRNEDNKHENKRFLSRGE